MALTLPKGFLSLRLFPVLVMLECLGFGCFSKSEERKTDLTEKSETGHGFREIILRGIQLIWIVLLLSSESLLYGHRLYTVLTASLGTEIGAGSIVALGSRILRAAAVIIGTLLFMLMYGRLETMIRELDQQIEGRLSKRENTLLTICFALVSLFFLWRCGQMAYDIVESSVAYGPMYATIGISRYPSVCVILGLVLLISRNVISLGSYLCELVVFEICIVMGVLFGKFAKGRLRERINGTVEGCTDRINAHYHLGEQVRRLDATLSWETLLYCAYRILSILSNIHSMKTDYKRGMESFMAEEIFWLSLMLFRLIFVQEQAQAIIPQIEQALHRKLLNKEEQLDVYFHLTRLRTQHVGFTVANVFPVNRNFIVTLVAGTVGLALIILELGDKELPASALQAIRSVIIETFNQTMRKE